MKRKGVEVRCQVHNGWSPCEGVWYSLVSHGIALLIGWIWLDMVRIHPEGVSSTGELSGEATWDIHWFSGEFSFAKKDLKPSTKTGRSHNPELLNGFGCCYISIFNPHNWVRDYECIGVVHQNQLFRCKSRSNWIGFRGASLFWTARHGHLSSQIVYYSVHVLNTWER